MLKIINFLPYFFVSLLLHVLVFFFIVVCRKEKPMHIFTPIDVTFYYPNQNTKEPSSLSKVEENLVDSIQDIGDIKESAKEDVKEQIKEPAKTKDDTVLKKKKEQVKKVKDSGENKNKKNKDINKNNKKSEDKNKDNAKKTASVQKVSDKQSVPTETGASQNLKSEKSLPNGNGSLDMGASLDTNDFKYPYYISQVRRKVATQWRWAESYGNLRVLLYFKINRDGSVNDIFVKESSGNEDYNRNALDTIRRASPFSELPEGYEGDSLGVFFEFKY
jgi:TonB family protein